MKKQEFLARLRKSLRGLPKNDVEERLTFYGEMIDDGIEDGLSEEDAVSRIGSVDEIARRTIADIPLAKIAKERIKPKRKLSAGGNRAACGRFSDMAFVNACGGCRDIRSVRFAVVRNSCVMGDVRFVCRLRRCGRADDDYFCRGRQDVTGLGDTCRGTRLRGAFRLCVLRVQSDNEGYFVVY